jgi:hypothetical protein
MTFGSLPLQGTESESVDLGLVNGLCSFATIESFGFYGSQTSKEII